MKIVPSIGKKAAKGLKGLKDISLVLIIKILNYSNVQIYYPAMKKAWMVFEHRSAIDSQITIALKYTLLQFYIWLIKSNLDLFKIRCNVLCVYFDGLSYYQNIGREEQVRYTAVKTSLQIGA